MVSSTNIAILYFGTFQWTACIFRSISRWVREFNYYSHQLLISQFKYVSKFTVGSCTINENPTINKSIFRFNSSVKFDYWRFSRCNINTLLYYGGCFFEKTVADTISTWKRKTCILFRSLSISIGRMSSSQIFSIDVFNTIDSSVRVFAH